MATLEENILRFLGEVVAYGGGSSLIAFLVFRFLGKNWIENMFAQKLQDYKHHQALELQRLKVEIDSMLSGVLKIQEKEFDTLPEAWYKLGDAYSRVEQLVSSVQTYPNLDRMSSQQLEEFLSNSEFYESQKQEIRDASSKLERYQEIIFWHRLHEVKKACSEFHNYVVRQGIFFSPTIKEKFVNVSQELWNILAKKQVGHEANDWKTQSEAWIKVQERAEPLYKSIETEIYTLLHAHGEKL